MKNLLLALVTTTFVVTGYAAEPFRSMTCKKTISDEIYVTTKSNRLAVKWVSRGGHDVVQLLRALADEAIPTSLLEAYSHLVIEFALPLKSCKFSDTAKFNCKFEQAGTAKALNLKISAKISPYDYDKQPDVYEGTLAGASIRTKFSGDTDERLLEFPMTFEVASPSEDSVKAVTDFFFAHHWNYDGFPQNPSCLVDNAFLID